VSYVSEAHLPLSRRGSNMVRLTKQRRRGTLLGHLIAAGVGALLAVIASVLGAVH
jgi:hypothetical protein